MSNTTDTAPDEKGRITLTPNEKGFIKLKVLNQNSIVLHFRVKVSSALGKLKKTYADRIGENVYNLRFYFDDRRIEDVHTPESLEMEDGDIIEVYQEQLGGSNLLYAQARGLSAICAI